MTTPRGARALRDAFGARAEVHPCTRYELNAGFARYEYSRTDVQYQAGLGYAERSPDFWKRNRVIHPERNLQLDVGAAWVRLDLKR